MCGISSASEVVGKSLLFLQGPGTDHREVARFVAAATAHQPIDGVELINYDTEQVPFIHTVSLRPMTGPNGIVELLRVESRDVRTLGSGKSSHRVPPGALSEVDKRAAASYYGSTCLRRQVSDVPEGEMTVVTQGYAPYPVVWASPAWLALCGFSACELLGNTLHCIQGPGTDQTEIRRMMDQIRICKPVAVDRLVNYDKHKVPFMQRLEIVPVASVTGAVFFRGSASSVSRLGAPTRSLRSDVWWGDEVEDYLCSWEEVDHSWGEQLSKLVLVDGASASHSDFLPV